MIFVWSIVHLVPSGFVVFVGGASVLYAFALGCLPERSEILGVS
jgi:hypothetical protein